LLVSGTLVAGVIVVCMKSYRDLDVYRRSYALALRIHQVSQSFPKDVQFDLGDQIRRASRSVPANIAEGYGRGKSSHDICNFLRTALGSNDEVLFNLEFLKDVNILSISEYATLQKESIVCGKQLTKLIQHITSN
jgi:four helix bundle protein